MKEFVCFSTTDVFVPVSQLSTRDLFYFLENLKIKQDFCLEFVVSLDHSINKRYDSPIPDYFLEQEMFKKVLILECLGCFTKSIVVSMIFLTHLFPERCLNCWLVMSQLTDSMCKYAHNRYFNNWSGDNASNKITCSLWDTLCILESLFWTFKFSLTQSKSSFQTFFD